MQQDPHIVLFLCTGNYFRSRFSEELFNHWAARMRLNWHAESRGLMRDMSSLKDQNIGKMSRHALKALEMRGIRPRGDSRWPQSVTRAEIEYADITIAVKEAEHFPMMEQHFPDLAQRIHYWAVDDIDVVPAQHGIAEAEKNVLKLLQRLRKEAR